MLKKREILEHRILWTFLIVFYAVLLTFLIYIYKGG